MRRDSTDVATVAATPKTTSRTTKLIQAAALAAMLVPLGVVAAEAGNINCVTFSGGSAGFCTGVGNYASGGGLESNTWNFYTGVSDSGTYSGPIYSFTIAGTPLNDFALDVRDIVHPVFSFNYPPLGGTGDNLTCVPTFNNDNLCGFFQVTQVVGDVTPPLPVWADGYRATIMWNGTSPVPPDLRITILKTQSPSEVQPYGFASADMLTEIRYAPFLLLLPGDPGIGGRGNEFSTFGVFRGPDLDPDAVTVVYTKDALFAVPDPASSILLLGIGLAGVAVRARRWKR